MAKGLRSSVKKANRSKLRSRVFGPVEEARAERLHAKLLETIQQPKPEPAKKSDMEIDSTEANNTAQEAAKEDDYPKEMEVDGAAPAPTKSRKKDDRKKRKQRGRKPKNQISFPTSRGKGALKPFSESRVRKRR